MAKQTYTFRLDEKTVANLDRIAEWLASERGESEAKRTEAVAYAAQQQSKKIPKKSAKNS